MIRRRRSLVVAAAVAALLAGMPFGAVAKKKKTKNFFMATVDGKTLKLPFHPTFKVGNATVAFFGYAQTRPRGRLLQTLSVGCGDFPPTTVPGTSLFCTMQLQVTKIGRHPSTRVWFSPSANQTVNFLSYDGTTVEGTFSIPALPSITGDAPIALEGHFGGKVQSGN